MQALLSQIEAELPDGVRLQIHFDRSRFAEELNIFSFVGIILLVGLVKKNGIMMVDFALTRKRAGLSAEDAIAVVGGLLFSQFLTLYITPIFYVNMARLEAALMRLRGRAEPTA